jgi:small subunit ribosomal protein S15
MNTNQVSRIVSSSPASSCARSNVAALLHTSSTINAELARRTGSYDPKKANTLIKREKRRKALEMRPHVVLGHRPGDEAKWQNCDLAKILVSENELELPTEGVESAGHLPGATQLPIHLNFGIGETEKQLLFRDLPELSAEAVVFANPDHNPETLNSIFGEGQEKEAFKLNHFAKVVDLRNANARGIAYENRRRIILAFSGPENAYDTGRTEVQGASHGLLIFGLR